jgi:23S rRNA pseudouridine1911/1915/1917 synthase
MSLVKRRADYSPSAAASAGADRAAAADGTDRSDAQTSEATALDARVPAEMAGLRLDQAAARLFQNYSRSRLQDWIKQNLVTVDGRPARARDPVWEGERISIVAATSNSDAADAAQDIALSVLFEDADLLVIDKPAGLVVHPGNGNPDGTLLNALLHHQANLAALPRAGIVHRLDKDTSGLLVVAKTLTAQTSLVRQLQARTVQRDYFAIVVGSPRTDGQIEAPVGRHPVLRTRMAVVASGRPAITHYRKLRGSNSWSLLHCKLETGRTHQIRVHLMSIGHPLVGDPVYLKKTSARALPIAAQQFPRQALHATRLALIHPATGMQMSWDSALPADMRGLLDILEADAAGR